MKLRFKFTVFFSLLFSTMMIVAVLIIYYVAEKSRQNNFERRLWAQANYSYSHWYRFALPDSMQKIITNYHPGTISQLQIFVMNKQGFVQYRYNKQNPLALSSDFLAKAKESSSYYYKQGSNESAVFYMPAPHEGYILVSGYDKFGLRRLKTLQNILSVVALAGISIIIFSAVVIVNQVTKPLIRIGTQMQRISENNMEERIRVRAGRLNYEEAQIATHFNAMLDRLERAFELQRSFVHHASHELRTPLATMLAQTELALRKDLTIEEARRTLESLKEDQQEMVELTNSLLLLSQYERTHTSAEWPLVRLDELLYDTFGMVKRMLPNVNVSLEFAQVPDTELFLSIQGNDSLIRSAFRNLIKNAWLYSDNKSVAITIDVTGTNIYLYFDNNGKLLTVEEQERLFVPFFRASNSTQKKGFGLGLNIIQRIVSLHKGSIGYLIYNNQNRFMLQFPKL